MISFVQGILALKLAASLLSYCHSQVIDTGATGCHITTSSTSNGFKAVFYSYTYGDVTSCYEDAFMTNGYRSNAITATANGVSDPSIYYNEDEYWFATAPVEGQIYGQTVDVTNFAVELTGYFNPPQDGFYTFAMSIRTPVGVTSSDDEPAMMFLGDGYGFDCCNVSSILCKYDCPEGNQPLALLNASSRGDSQPSAKVYLKSSEHYPIRYVKVNGVNAADFGITVTTPSGTNVSTNWDEFIYQYEETDVSDACLVTTVFEPTTTTTTTWTGVGTSTMTTTVSNNSAVIIIDVPYSTATITTTETWTGTGTSTTTEGPPPGSVGNYTVIIYEPSSSQSSSSPIQSSSSSTQSSSSLRHSSSSSTQSSSSSTQSSSSPIQSSSSSTQSSSSSTQSSSSPIQSSSSSTQSSSSLSQSSSSYSTPTLIVPASIDSTITSSGPSGPVVVVESKTSYSSTKFPITTSTWTGSSVVTTLIPNPSGTGSIYVVEVPSPPSAALGSTYTTTEVVTSITTITSPCTGSLTSTYSTTAPNGEVVVIVETPATIITLTTGCECEHATTSTSSGSNDQTVIYLGVPITTVTSTVPCTGSLTITSTVTDSENGLTVIVQTPSAGAGTATTKIPTTATTAAVSSWGSVSVYEGAANALSELSLYALLSSFLLLILI